MGLNVGDSGKLFGYNTKFNLSSNTSLELTITDPGGNPTDISSSRISAPATDGVFDENGIDRTYLANQYMQFTNLVTDFTIDGEWEVCGIYTNTNVTPNEIFTLPVKVFTVDPEC